MNQEQPSNNSNSLYPLRQPFREGFLEVSNIHKIRFALYGNPKGKPVFFIHGGPGCGSTDDDACWFDPDKYFVITHDQRGSGKSIPRAEIKENTPQYLVEDTEKLRNYLRIQSPVSIFGGSWGSTLALLYAEAYPQNVLRMILRGVFTCTYDDQDYFYSESGAARFSPEAWNRFISSMPPGEGRIQERFHNLIEKSNEEEKIKWYTKLAEYEYSFFGMLPDEVKNEIEKSKSVIPEMRINTFYQANRFFLEDDQILINAERIKNIPVTIIHGTRDIICPPEFAWKLYKKLSNAELIYVQDAGHLSSDPKIREALLKAVNNW